MPSHEARNDNLVFPLGSTLQTRQCRRKPAGMSPSASFPSLTSLYPAQPCRELRGPAEPSGAQRHKGTKARRHEGTKPCGMLRERCGGSALPGCPAAGPAPHSAGTEHVPPSRGSSAQNSPRGCQKTPEVTGRRERGQPGSGERALFLFIPRIWLFV